MIIAESLKVNSTLTLDRGFSDGFGEPIWMVHMVPGLPGLLQEKNQGQAAAGTSVFGQTHQETS